MFVRDRSGSVNRRLWPPLQRGCERRRSPFALDLSQGGSRPIASASVPINRRESEGRLGMLAFAQWVSDSSLSLAIRENVWLIPMIQISHIVAIAMIVTAAVMITARIAGVASRSQTMQEIAQRFLPWIWAGLIVLAPTGVVLIIAEPQRTLGNPTFWWKMAMLALAVGLTASFQVSLRRDAEPWEDRGQKAGARRIFAVSSVVLWLGIVATGRLIAYTY